MAKHHKIRLLPFAEHLPYRDVFPWPARLVAKAGPYIPGEEYTLLPLQGRRFGVLICWESIFPDLVRRFVKGGADFMVNIANEAWFGKTAAPYQFVAMNVFRAVENRITIVRSANTGISCFIDPYGRILGRVTNHGTDIFVEGYHTQEIPLLHQHTFYTHYGDIFVYLNIVTAISMLLTFPLCCFD
jgi:apolipoprotein N-acyltransferase